MTIEEQKQNLIKIKKYISSKKTNNIDFICEELGIEPYEFYGLVQTIINGGAPYDIVDGEVIKLAKPKINEGVYKVNNTDEVVKLLLISDTHLCSKFDRLDILRYLYDKAVDKQVTAILHSGDFTDGKSNRAEHIYELKEHSFEGQKQYCVDKYPKSDIPTYVIAGNHDLWWYKSAGSDIVKAICQERDDLIYLGPDRANLEIGNCKIHMYHGMGGSSYAKSYKPQKYLDAFPAEKRPHIMQMGHIHQAFYYRQDHTNLFQTGSLEDETPFSRSLGLNNNKSCWWVNVHIDNKGNPYLIDQQLETFDQGKVRIKKR